MLEPASSIGSVRFSAKLMRFNQLKAKICFKADSNSLLSTFSIRFQPSNLMNSNSDTDFESKLYQKFVQFNRNWSNLIENGRKRPDFVIFVINFDKICRFRFNNPHLDGLF